MLVLIYFLFFFCDPLIVQSFRHSLYINSPSTADEENTNENNAAQWFLQQLDHFDSSTLVLWKQRYFVNTEYFNNSTCDRAFLYVGGEGPINSNVIKNGTCHEAAKTYGGILFVVEHRFYGLSQPFTDLSTENLRYLNSQQALADLSTFMQAMKETYNLTSNAKWILVGGSYAGSLAAWMRLKYPHLVQGAVSSSAPLFAKLDYPEYLQIVSNDFALQGKECINNINTALQQLDDHFSGQAPEDISTLFNLCNETESVTNNTLDKENLFEHIVDGFALIAQTSGLHLTVKHVCDKMGDISLGKAIYRLGEVTKTIYGNDTDNCFAATYEDWIISLKNTTISENSMMRQWWYQTCTEVGFYQTTDPSNAAFGNRISLDFWMNMCRDLYGQQYDKTFIQAMIDRTNTYYGGYDFQASNVVFTHGSLDPWYPVGLFNKNNENYIAFLISGVAHCADLGTPKESDSLELQQTRAEIMRRIGIWLADNSNNTAESLKSVVFMLLIIFINVIF